MNRDSILPSVCCALAYIILSPFAWGDFFAFVFLVSILSAFCYGHHWPRPKQHRPPRSRYFWLWLALALWLFVYAWPRLSEPFHD